jgi:hypothetical protein
VGVSTPAKALQIKCAIDCDDLWPHAIDSLQQKYTSYEAVCSRTGGGGGE